MSEKKKEDWKKEMREIIREELKNNQPTTPPSSEQHTEKPHTEEHTHFKVGLDYLNQDDSCPECKKGLDSFGKDYMKKVLKERKDLPYVCEECGTPVKEDERECPTCGSKEARSK